MKNFLRSFLFLAVIVVQSCSDNEDTDCSTVSCDQPGAILEFKIVDIETGDNIAGTIISGQAIEVINTSTTSEASYDFNTNNDINTLRINIINSGNYLIKYGTEEIFNLTVDAELQNGDCCPFIRLNEISIEGAEYELDEETGVYTIKKNIKTHLITGESLENYHAFFENSQLQIKAEEESHVNTESLDIDVVMGDKLVFKLLTYEDPEETVADDEITRIVYFEIDPEATEFTLNPDNFEEANAIIGLLSSTSFIKPIESGEITGSKISGNEWQVEVKAAVGEEGETFSIQVEEAKKAFNKSTYEDVWMPIYRTHVFN